MNNDDCFHLKARFEAPWQAGLPLKSIWLARFVIALMVLLFLFALCLPTLHDRAIGTPGAITWGYSVQGEVLDGPHPQL